MSRRFFRNKVLLPAAVLCALLSHAGYAAVREPIVITASRMDAERMGERVRFSGNVELKKEGVTLTSDVVTVFYQSGRRAIREIEALGNVTVRREGRVALANRAVYHSSEEKIVLTGDARIIEKDNELGGDRITLFIRDDRSIVEGGNVLFYQDQKLEKRRGH